MKRFINCGTLSLGMLFPFIAPVFCFIDSLCISALSKKWRKHTALRVFFLSLGQLLSGSILTIISLIVKSSGKLPKQPINIKNNKNRKVTGTINKITFIPTHRHKTIYHYYALCLPGLFYLLSMFSINFASEFFSYQITKLTAIIVQIIFASILCWLGLSLYFHKHHFWSFPSIIIGYIIVCSINYSFFIPDISKNIPLHLTLNFLAYLFFTIQEFIEKILMNKYFISPPTILLIEGAFNTIVMSLIIIILHFVPCNGYLVEWQYCDYSNHIESFTYLTDLFNDSNNGWYFIGLMISSGGFNTMVKYTVYNYSPIHRCVSDLLSCIFSVLYFELPPNGLSFTNLLTYQIIVMMIGYVIILFSCLVYNEFIILNFCGLSENTKKMILNRTKNEVITYEHEMGILIQMNNEILDEL